MPDETTTPPTNERTTGQGGKQGRSSFRPTEPKAADAKPEEKTDEQKAEEGHPDEQAQIKLVAVSGPSTLRLAIDALPPIGALQGIKANFEHYSSEELIDALKTLPLPADNVEALDARNEIVRKLEAGEFKR
jgi:hypothetical protein